MHFLIIKVRVRITEETKGKTKAETNTGEDLSRVGGGPVFGFAIHYDAWFGQSGCQNRSICSDGFFSGWSR